MKNTRLSVKVGLLVAVLLATTVVIAVVGVRQLARLDGQFRELVDTTGRAVIMTAEARVALNAAARAEKNAILVADKGRAAEFADQARQAFKRMQELHGRLVQSLGSNPATPEGKALLDLDRAIEEFERNQKEVLRLAVIKSNYEGKSILNKDLHQRVHDAEEFVASLGESVAATGSTSRPASDELQKAKVLAGQQLIGRLYDLLYHLDLHLDAAEEKEIARMDIEVRPRIAAVQESLRRLSVMLNDAERSRGLSVLASLDTLKAQVTNIQNLSHINSDLYATEITVTTSYEVGTRCDALLADLLKILTDRLGVERIKADDTAILARNIVISIAVIGTLVSLVLAVLMIRSITRPVGQGVGVFEAIAAGDLTRRMNLDRHDEMGRLGAASDCMADALCKVVTQIRSLADRLGHSAGELSGVSHDLLAQSQEMATQAESVAAATEQTTSNITGMAAAAEQMSVNVSSISSASEEVSVNVGTISASAEETSRIVGSVTESIAQITASLQGVARMHARARR